MKKKVDRKLFKLSKVPVVLLVTILLLALFAFSVFAAGTPTVTVGSASGNKGATVNIPVSISNSAGVSGVSFKLNYNSSIVEPRMDQISWGAIIQGMREAHHNAGGGFISIAIVSASSVFSSDGTIVTIPFTLKNGGQTSLSLSDLTASDGGSIPCNGVSGAITVTVVKTPLAKVGQPTWSGDTTINWTTVANAASYEVKLYKSGSLARTVTVAHPGSSYNFSSDMSGGGSYTVTVQAKAGSSELYTDGAVSGASSAKIKTEPLAQVNKPTWSGNTISWTAVANAATYQVILYKNGSPSPAVSATATSYNFSDRINQQGAGSYTVTVRAMASSAGFYTDGAVSALSDVNDKTAALGQAGKPTWNGDTISWSAVANAASYQVILYKNGSANQTVSATAATYNFSTRISQESAGSYTVTVRALADPAGPYVNGPVSAPSEASVKSVTLARVARPAWSGDRITWSAVPNTVSYEVILYKGASKVETRTVAAGQTAVDFKNKMQLAGAGSYSASVQARGDGKIYLHGQVSERSAEKNYDPEQEPSSGETDPDLPGGENLSALKPVWLADPAGGLATATIAWRRGEDTVEAYTITLYRGSNQVTTETLTPDDTDDLLSFNFADQIDEPGLYYVMVEALRSGGSSESLDSSTILVITAETEAGSGVFQAEGYLPFAGVRLRFTSETAVRGAITLSCLSSCEYRAPENRLAAGIFLGVTLDQSLNGILTLIEVEYDPGQLPEGLSEDSLRLYRYDAEKGSWELLNSGVYLDKKSVWAEVPRFSVIGIFGEQDLQQDTAAGFSWSSLARVPYYLWPLPLVLALVIFLLTRRRRPR
ncbi:MAG: cohesin domain-containing protein [Bacillota bacterium]